MEWRSAMTTIQISENDFRNITRLLDGLPSNRQKELGPLEEELARAEILPTEQLPSDVVTMYSSVVYEDVDTGKLLMVKLTFPNDADIEEGRISILSPVGAALLGLKVGQEIAWPLPDGRTGRIRVRQLIQPVEPVCSLE